MSAAEWVGVVVGVFSAIFTFVGAVLALLQYRYTRAHPGATLRIETASSATRIPVIMTVKPTDVQELESRGDVVRSVWYRISNEIRASIPRFGVWRPLTGDLKLGRGDVVWFRCVTANVSERVLSGFHVSFYEFPVLKRVRPTLRIVRRESPVATSSVTNGETIHRVRGFQVVLQKGWHWGGQAWIEHLNPYDQAVLDAVFRVSPALIESLTFRRLPKNIVDEILNAKPRPLTVIRTEAGSAKFQTEPE